MKRLQPEIGYDQRHLFHGEGWIEYPKSYTNGDAVFRSSPLVKKSGKCPHCGERQLFRENYDLTCFLCGWRNSLFYANHLFNFIDNFLAKDYERLERAIEVVDKELYELYAKTRQKKQTQLSHEGQSRKEYMATYQQNYRKEHKAEASQYMRDWRKGKRAELQGIRG